MDQERYGALGLENQPSFLLYACSREVIKRYRPYLDNLGLTYTQYLVMTVVWAEETVSVRDLGRQLYLDSGTLTPVLKTLEKNGLITRRRSREDERVLLVSLTQAGNELREEALCVPEQQALCGDLTDAEARQLTGLLNKILAGAEAE